MPVEADLPLNTVVPAKGNFKVQESPQVIHQVLECTVVLVAGLRQAFLNVVTHQADFGHVVLQEGSEPFPGSSFTRRIVEFANEGQDLLQSDFHGRPPAAYPPETLKC